MLWSMSNITLTVPDDVLRVAKIRAAERGTSVSAMVRDYLISVGRQDGEFQRLERLQHSVIAEITSFRAADRVSRDELHDRALR
jgi:plasmid stability protein